MSLRIKPRTSKTDAFQHAGYLPPEFDRFDPRDTSFDVSEVELDLRGCEFVRAPAVLWTLVYLALAARRGAQCRLLVPLNIGVCVHLKAFGLFDTLKEYDVDVDDRQVGQQTDSKILLPITGFRTANEAVSVTNRAFEKMQVSGVGAVNLTGAVTELFGELAMNAAQHSESEVGGFGCVLFSKSENGGRFTCTVADGGIGVAASLRRNPAHRARTNYDWDALELAVRERVSGTGDPHRGIGLYGVSEDVRRPGRSLLLHSGLGSLRITPDLQSFARRTRLFPGTLAHLSIPA